MYVCTLNACKITQMTSLVLAAVMAISDFKALTGVELALSRLSCTRDFPEAMLRRDFTDLMLFLPLEIPRDFAELVPFLTLLAPVGLSKWMTTCSM